MRAQSIRILGEVAHATRCAASDALPAPSPMTAVPPPSPTHNEPRTLTGKRPSAASLQREREYVEWLNNLPYFDWLERPDRHRDESYGAFMAVRRGEREDARLQKVIARRSQQRREQPSAAALARQREYHDWLQNLPTPTRDDDERDDSWGAFMKHRRQQQQQQRNQARRKGTKRGRPVNPDSQRLAAAESNAHRQQLLKKHERQRQHQLFWQPRAAPAAQRVELASATKRKVRIGLPDGTPLAAN